MSKYGHPDGPRLSFGAMALELPPDQLLAAMVDAARLLARSAIFQMPAAGKDEMRKMLGRRGAVLTVVVDVGRGKAELVAVARKQMLRAPLR
jgi:hypothetical protein